MYTVTYEYYTETYGGKSLSEDDFPFVMRKASMIVDNMTFGRLGSLNIDNVDDNLKDKINTCLCEVADKISANSEDGVVNDGIKSSESVANWSVSFATSSLPKSVMGSLKSSVNLYLGGTFLTCMWV